MKRLLVSGIVLSFILVWVVSGQTDVLSPGFYDDDIPVLDYTGTWSDILDTEYYQGSAHSLSSAGSVEFSIFGGGFAIYSSTAPTLDDALLCIDDLCTSISYYSPVTAYGVKVVDVTGLAYGVHTVRIDWVSSSVIVDAIHVYESPLELTPEQTLEVEVTVEVSYPTPRSEVSWDIDSQRVAFDYRTDAGTVVLVIMQAASLFVLILLTFVLMFRGRKWKM